MGLLLSRADSVPQALQGALHELQRLWRARRVIAAAWTGAAEPSLTSTGPAIGWDGLPAELRETIGALRQRPLLTPTDGTSPDVGVSIEHPEGQLAGHPPGILAHPDGEAELLRGGRSFPLAVLSGTRRTEATCSLPPRSTLLLYTDGLVERRRVSIDTGMARAGAALRQGQDLGVEELASQVMTGMAPPDGYEDDVALVLFRHPEPLDLTFPADQGQLTPARAALRSWLVRCGLSRRMVQDVLVAAGEACANAIEHGHRDVPGTGIRLRAEATVTRLRVTVTDTGSWRTARPSPDPLRGHGIALMRALMEHVTIEAGEAGTSVNMEVAITP